MNGFLWAAAAFASIGVAIAIFMAGIVRRSASNPDGWAALGTAFVLLCLFAGVAGLLAIIGLLAKVFA